MRKILQSTIVLLLFTIAILLFQISCKKEATAQTSAYVLPPATTSHLGGVIPDGTTITVDGSGKISTASNMFQQQNKLLYGVFGQQKYAGELWIANSDGSNASKININLPQDIAIDIGHFTMSPDHKTIFFNAFNINGETMGSGIYACNIDGSNVHQVVQSPTNGSSLGVAF